ncbi:hypothetical protein D3C78_1691590 [compost metagenome]
MTRRARWRHRLEVWVLHGRQALRREAELELLYCAAGNLDGWLADARPFSLAAGEGLLFGEDERDGGILLLEALEAARLLRVQLWRR